MRISRGEPSKASLPGCMRAGQRLAPPPERGEVQRGEQSLAPFLFIAVDLKSRSNGLMNSWEKELCRPPPLGELGRDCVVTFHNQASMSTRVDLGWEGHKAGKRLSALFNARNQLRKLLRLTWIEVWQLHTKTKPASQATAQFTRCCGLDIFFTSTTAKHCQSFN